MAARTHDFYRFQLRRQSAINLPSSGSGLRRIRNGSRHCEQRKSLSLHLQDENFCLKAHLENQDRGRQAWMIPLLFFSTLMSKYNCLTF